MKRYLFATAAIAVLALASCNKDQVNEEYDLGSSISVVEVKTIFSPDGGDGFIKVASDTPFSVSSTRPWCTFSKAGDSVVVSVSPYYEVGSRYSMVTVKNEANDSVNVTVHQFGSIIQNFDDSGIYANNAGGSAEIAYNSNINPIVTSSVDWAVPSVQENRILVEVAANEGGLFRKGEILCKLGNRTYNVPVAQLDSTEILSKKNWELTGIDVDGNPVSLTGVITRKMTGYAMKFTGTDISWTFDINLAGNKFGIPLGSSIGRYMLNGKNLYVIPVIAEGTAVLKAGEGTDTGYFYIPLDKESAEDKWSGTVENANLRFEYWEKASRPDPSQGGIRLIEVTLSEK